ncbi:MAG TPA: transglycosylase SLT domain-containing protein [Polyangiales bacterium]|nr:transglycosylase SLT domain-containing protein [Polyangiales bacterium]
MRAILGAALVVVSLAALGGGVTPFRSRAAAQSELEPIRERVRAKDWQAAQRALVALPRPLAERADVRYLTARVYEALESYKDALESLPKDTTSLPRRVVRDIAERRGRWLARAGRCADARLMLASLADRDGPDSELSLRAADCFLLQGDAAAALAILKGLRGAGSRRFAVRSSLAKVLLQTGDKAGAIRELRALYIEQPEHARNSDVESQLQTLLPNFKLTDDERLTRAENWLEAQQHDTALEEIERVKPAKNDKALRARVLHLRGLVLFRTRSHYEEAAKILAQAAALGGSARVDDAYMAAQALARADKNAQAVRAYRAFADKNPKHRNAQEALHDAAWLELRHELPGGEAHMKAFLKSAEKRKDSERATSALWELAFYYFTKKRCGKETLEMFERYSQTSSSAMVKARGLYWAGRCALIANKRAQGIEYLKSALAVEPLHFYALVARSRLASIGVDPGLPFGVGPEQFASTTQVPIQPLTLPDDVQFYLRLGLWPEALRALQEQEGSARAGKSGDSLVALAATYHSLGEYTRPYHLAERERDEAVRDAPFGPTRAIWDVLFPRPYAAEVAYAAQENELAPELIYAVMRKESAFNPSVVSYADAIGLMQLLERTAKSVADDLSWKVFTRAMLYEPEVNVMLGSRYVANLIERYRGQAVPAIAAYNAGEHRVDPWLKRGAKGGASVELDRWVEDIPIDQTRNYVRRVVANWARYLYLNQPGRWPLELPLTLSVKGSSRPSG